MDLDFLCIKIFLNLVEDSGESDDMYVSRWSIVTGNINEHCDWNGNHSYCLYKECEYSFNETHRTSFRDWDRELPGIDL